MSTETKNFGTGKRENHDSSKFYNRKMYQIQEEGYRAEHLDTHTPEQIDIIYNHDSQHMKHLPHNSVDLMITSPPYNVGKEYDEDLTYDKYAELLYNVFKETHRVLVYGGRACINVANIGRKPYIPLNALVSSIMCDIGYLMRGEIVWDKGSVVNSSCAWGSFQSASNPVLRDAHEYILVFSKGYYKKANKGENTISKQGFIENTKSIWRMNPASAKKEKHPAPFPVELPSRLIDLYSYKNDIVLDPFIGVGTTAVAAKNLERKFIGYEINQEYIDIAHERLENVFGTKYERSEDG